MFDEPTRRSIQEIAARRDVEPAALFAVAEVESGGTAFALVEGRREPIIRFEGHYFDRRLPVAKRRHARKAGLSSPVAGAVKNPNSQAERWRLFDRAAAIDRRAACESVSWGVGQVMGEHWHWLGYASVDALVADARGGAEGQVRLMVRYIEKAGLLDALRRRDWTAFARGYNGPTYARSGYHRRLEAAYRRYAGGELSSVEPKRMSESIDTCEDIRNLQRMLSAAGYPVSIDGLAGPDTRRAIRRFQKDHGLIVDGIAGSQTIAALRRAMPFDGFGGGGWGAIIQWLTRLFGRAEAR